MSPAIAIIGAGPGGLTLACLLERQGIDYVVYERDANPADATASAGASAAATNRGGGTLDLHPETGQRALRECGLFDEFLRYARYDDTVFTLTDQRGEKVMVMGQGRDAPEIDRAALRDLLLAAVPQHKIHWGHALLSASREEDGTGVVLRFANGAVVRSAYSLVVGADGARSKMRSLVTDAVPEYSGRMFVESRIDRANPLYPATASRAGAGTFLSMGAAELIVTQRQGDGSYRSYLGIPVPADFFRSGRVDVEDTEAMRRLLRRDFYSDWSAEFQDLIQHATDFRPWPLYSLPGGDMAWRAAGDVTLMGDAAHLTIPNGEGVNHAMADASVLAAKIAEHGVAHVDRAVREYEAEMLPRGAATIADGKAMAELMFGGDPKALLQVFGS